VTSLPRASLSTKNGSLSPALIVDLFLKVDWKSELAALMVCTT